MKQKYNVVSSVAVPSLPRLTTRGLQAHWPAKRETLTPVYDTFLYSVPSLQGHEDLFDSEVADNTDWHPQSLARPAFLALRLGLGLGLGPLLHQRHRAEQGGPIDRE